MLQAIFVVNRLRKKAGLLNAHIQEPILCVKSMVGNAHIQEIILCAKSMLNLLLCLIFSLLPTACLMLYGAN